MIIAIVAVARNLAIGKDGKLPWHYSADLKFFKQTTTGHIVVMGWSTWESIGKPLPNRLNVILTRTGNVEQKDFLRVCRSREEVLDLSKDDRDLFIIGGSRTYQTFAGDIDKWYVTEVPVTVEDADTFMPADFLSDFAQTGQIRLDDELQVKVYSRVPDLSSAGL